MEKSVLTISIKPEQRAKLTALAAQEKVSMAEIVRRALDEYDPEALKELEKLADDLEQRTLQKLMEANRKFKDMFSA